MQENCRTRLWIELYM